MMANHLRRKLPRAEWRLTAVDRSDEHYYQPGFLFLPFGEMDERAIVKSRRAFLPSGVDFVEAEIDRVEAGENRVLLAGGEALDYDLLIVATGSTIVPTEVEGMAGEGWRKNVFDFYTFDGARALRDRLATWEGGKLVVHVTEMPIKCPVAPLEFAFLADSFFKRRGLREKVDITYVTPLSGAFTKPKASKSSATCSRKRASGSSLTSRSRKSIPRANASSVTTGARCPTTCSSRPRPTWAARRSSARVWATI